MSDSEQLISVIVPIYKAEDSLKRCIDSILAQDYQNFEVLLIDDGSPDNCPVICDEYVARGDSRVRVLHKKNAGVSAARNDGLDMARGEYIMFVDSDDALMSDAMALMKDKMTNTKGCDLVIGNTLHIREDNPDGNSFDVFPDVTWNLNEFLKHSVRNGNNSLYVVWGKLYKRSIIEENNLRFDTSMNWFEDTKFMYTYFTFCHKISIINKCLYIYYQALSGTLSTNKRNDYLEIGMRAIEILKILFGEDGYDGNTANFINDRKYFILMNAIERTFYHRLPIKEKIRIIRAVTGMKDIREIAKLDSRPNKNARLVSSLVAKKACFRLFLCYTFIYDIKKKRRPL